MVFKIEGLMEKPRWYDLNCTCSKQEGDVENQYPIGKCLKCKFQYQEDLMPRKSFKIMGKTCNKIKINRGPKYEEILGWYNILG